jgi:hypothetical protein
MKFGFRIPSLNKRIAARTSVKRMIRQSLGFKAPRGMGWITDPKKRCTIEFITERAEVAS